MGESKRRQKSKLSQEQIEALIEKAEPISLEQYESNPFDAPDTGMSLTVIPTPLGIQKIDTQPTGVIYYATKQSDTPDYWANTEYCISYVHWKRIGVIDERQEMSVGIAFDDGGEFVVYYTEVPENKLSHDKMVTMFFGVLKSCPLEVRVKVMSALKEQTRKTGKMSFTINPAKESLGILVG